MNSFIEQKVGNYTYFLKTPSAADACEDWLNLPTKVSLQ